jgi:hypothetical protein
MKLPITVASCVLGWLLVSLPSDGGGTGNDRAERPEVGLTEALSEAKASGGAEAARSSDVPCSDVGVVPWLSPDPREVPCGDPSNPLAYLTASPGPHPGDINGDGQMEYGRLGENSRDVLVGGNPVAQGLSMYFTRIASETSRVEVVEVQIVPVDIAARLSKTRFGGFPNISVYLTNSVDVLNSQLAGWRDMDGDGDLDYIVWVYAYNSTSGTNGQIWFENVGYEKPAPPLAADINRDGRVDGADLGMLLIAWGPTP